MDIKSGKYCIPIGGEWHYRLDPEDRGIAEKWYNEELSDVLILPGTLNENSIGEPLKSDFKLTPESVRSWKEKYSYAGACWYQKKIIIPKEWDNKRVFLMLERIIEKSCVWIDDMPLGSVSSLIAPHEYEIRGDIAKAGEHTLTVLVDNRDAFHLGIYGHSYTNETQTIWNGIVGKMLIYVKEQISMKDVGIFTEFAECKEQKSEYAKVKVAAVIENTYEKEMIGQLNIQINEKATGNVMYENSIVLSAEPGCSEFSTDCIINSPITTWDEFNPSLYEISLKVIADKEYACDEEKITFGFRKLESVNGVLKLNGNRIFLRGNLECCVHPLTGYPPCDAEYWKKIMRKVKAYGLNHLRFHSNCPPEAAFEAADEAGVYLQIEGPIWLDIWFIGLGTHKEHYDFMPEEAQRIIKSYGNHPSFCIFSNGNELRGDFGLMHDIIEKLRSKRPDILYTLTSNYDRVLDPEDDLFISVEADKKAMRGNRFKREMAETIKVDYSQAVESRRIPLIGHESGQFFNYPDINGIAKFKGSIEPLNLEVIKKDLEKCGLLAQADKYIKASGTFALRLYKEEIEAYLRTAGFGGFQLLGIQDFPGQCTATIGLLDFFWDSKGLVSPEEFRQFCCEVVPLVKLDKRVYNSNDSLRAEVMTANFTMDDICADVYWEICEDTGAKLYSGAFKTAQIKAGTQDIVGFIADIDLSRFEKPAGLKLSVGISGTEYMNSWDIWVYPEIRAEKIEEYAKNSDIHILHKWDNSIPDRLSKGERILLIPDKDSFTNRTVYESGFYPVFWSPVFCNSKKPCGLYLNKQEPFKAFPTDSYANYQWYHLLEHSFNIDVDYLPSDFNPIIDVIPNYYYNHRLTNLVEARVGQGLLLICTMQIDDPETYDVGKWLKYSILEYMKNADINSIKELSTVQIKAFFERDKLVEDIREPFAKEDFIN